MSAAGDIAGGRMLPDRERLPPGEALLLPYQQRLLATTAQHQVVVCEKSRRIGFTWAIAADAVLVAASAKGSGGMDCYYLAYEKEMTREFIDTCAAWARLFDKIASAVEEFVFEPGEGDRSAVMAFRIKFASGFEIVALSSRPRNLRGRQGYVILDEAAFHDDLDEVLKAAFALLIWGGKVLVISTHNGVENPFNQLVEQCRTGQRPYGLVRVTFDEALADGLYKRICLVAGKAWSAEAESSWRASIVAIYGEGADEELHCIPRVGSGAWIGLDLIMAAEHADAGKPDLYRGGLAFIGNDIARRRDRWVATALERVGDVLWMRELVVEHGITFAAQDAIIDRLMRDYRVLRLGMDQTGMGEKPVEDAKRRHGSGRVEGIVMSGDRRLDVATAAKQVFESGKVRIAKDPDLRADLMKLKRVAGPSGAPRLLAGRDASGHADRAWALMIALAVAGGAVEIDMAPGDFRAMHGPRFGGQVDGPLGTRAVSGGIETLDAVDWRAGNWRSL